MTGLVPGAMYDISVSYPNGASYTLNLSANEAGVIPSSSVLAYDAGLPLDPADPGTGRMANGMGGNMAGREALLLPGESIKVIVKKGTQTVTNFTVPYVTSGTKPNAYTSNSAGYLRNAFVCANNEDVYVSFRQFTAGEKVRAYIVPDRIKWKFGDRINDISGGYESFTLPSSSSVYGPQYKIWTNSGGNCAPIGEYDIIIERGVLDGFLEDGDIVDSQVTVGFMIQGAPSSADIIEQIATDKDYTYKNIFSPSETVYVYMNPKVRSRVFESIMKNGFAIGMVLKYVTHHKAAWNAGDSILDQTQGIEGDMVQWGCYNESLVAVWPAPLTPGDYDIIIDANKNGIYDPGVDFLDNIDENNQQNYGFRVLPSPPPCNPQCVDDSKCEDGNQDTVNVCNKPGACNSTCSSYKTSCDLTVDKVNYIPEQTMEVTLNGRNESDQDLKCGVEIALKRDKLNPVWNSLDDDIFITIPAGTEVVRKITKFIPSTWAGTDSRNGSDYAIYTVREDKTRWDKGDNFNIHVKWECPITCLNATECDDHNAGNIDSCTNPGTCSSSCTHSSCPIACNADSGCDDGNPLTIDACGSPATCSAACTNTACSPACSNDAQCGDGNPLTFDTCDLMGTCSAACSHTACTPACSIDSECDDANYETIDTCSNAGACSASCTNCTIMTCRNDADCSDGNGLTRDTCASPGTCASSCSVMPCTAACTSDAQCNDGNQNTADGCMSPNTCDAVCINSIIACSSDTECNDNNSATTDKCFQEDASWSYCEHFTPPNLSCTENHWEEEILPYQMNGRYSVLIDFQNSISNVIVINNATKTHRVIRSTTDGVMNINLSRQFVVWTEYDYNASSNRSTIYLYNIETGDEKIIQPPSGANLVWNVSNYLDKVVYDAYGPINGARYEVYYYDNETGQNVNISNTTDSDEISPIIVKNTVVFFSGKDKSLYSYDIASKTKKLLTYAATGGDGRISFDGETIAWEDYRKVPIDSLNDRNADFDIYMYTMATGVTKQITTDINGQKWPVVSGKRIFWWDQRNNPNVWNNLLTHIDIYMYDISAGVESRLQLSDPSLSFTMNQSSRPMPFGDTLYFYDYGGTYYNRYLCKYMFP